MHRRLVAARASKTSSAAIASQTSTSTTIAQSMSPHRPPQMPPSDLEAQLVTILQAPADPALLASQDFARREVALYDVIETAPLIEVWQLHKRVSKALPDDCLASALARFAPDRRARVIAFMADARRRQALRARAA
jgi:hypothetical protein